MSAYLLPISTAAVVFPLIAAVLTLPYVLYSYRRYGSISVLRSIILFSFVFYLQCAYYLIILPLPDPAMVAMRTDEYLQFIPFYFVYDAIRYAPTDLTSLSSWLSFLTSSYVLVPAFNILLTLPFGIYLAYYFKTRLRTIIILTLALSLFFEITQLSGLFGVYPRPYRIVDVDDLILNTLGGMLGYFVYTRFLRFLPSKERIDQKSAERSATVSYVRRLAALLVDSFLVGLAAWLAVRFFKVDALYASVGALLLYYPLFALPTRGRTPGKVLVRIRLEATATARLPLWLLLLVRYFARNAVMVSYQLFALLMRANAIGAGYDGSMGDIDAGSTAINELISSGVVANGSGLSSIIAGGTTWLGVLSLAAAVIGVLLLVDFLLSFRSKRGRRLWYERLSKTRNVSSFRRT